MNRLEELKNILEEKNASLVVLYKNGEIKEYYQDRIKDIKEIITNDPLALEGAIVADKVIGKLAASILTVAKVKEIYAKVISKYALEVLKENNVKYEFEKEVDYIINKEKTDMCPMEKKFKDEKNIYKIYDEIFKQ